MERQRYFRQRGASEVDQSNEKQRLEDLKHYALLDTAPEESFDRITRIAKKVFGVPIALISLVDENRQWFKSHQGLETCETPRDISFCTHAIEKNQPLIVHDASEDPRFRDSPLVTGDPNIRFYAGIPLRSPKGFNLGTLCVMDRQPRIASLEHIEILRDLARLVVDEIELRALAAFDCLTGMHRRSKFMEVAETELQRAIRYGSNFTILIFDIDHFKTINDTHGHAAGDLVLQKVAEICKTNLRSIDVASRFGGDEFVVLLPETDASDACVIAERLRHQFETCQIEEAGHIIQFTTSFGLADHANSDLKTINAILNEADDYLYEAKTNGRNRVLASTA